LCEHPLAVRPALDRRLAVLPALLFGCSSRGYELGGDIPARIAWGAVLAEAHGNPAGSSGLIHRDLDGAFRLPLSGDPGDVLTFAGFSQEDLVPFASALTDVDTIANHPVRRAGPGDTALKPSWVGTATIGSGATTLEPSVENLVLSADGWLPACPNILRAPSTGIADATCAVGPCPVQRAIKDCALTVDLKPCGLDVIAGVIGHDGAVAFDPSTIFGSCSASPGSGEEELRIECVGGTLGTCTIDLFQPPFDAPLSIARQHVVDPAPGDKPYVSLSDEGHIGGLVELGSQIAVITSVSRRAQPCDGGGPNELVFLDEETLAITPGPALPPCTFAATADPSGDGFLALVLDATVAAIARYDATGTVRRATRSLERGPVSMSTHYPIAMAVATTGTSAAIGVAMVARNVQPPFFSYLLAFEASSLAPTGTTPLGAGLNDHARAASLRSVTEGHAGGFAVLDFDDTKVWLTDAYGNLLPGGRLGVPRQTKPLPTREALLLTHVLPDTVIFSFGGVGETMILDTSMSNGPVLPYRIAPEFELLADPFAAAPWRYEPEVAIVGFTERDFGAEASVALLDVARAQFRPGRTIVGNGVVGHMIVDHKNRVWLSLPDTGDVVRVSPR
jgi:hypothetical protein